MTLTWDVPETDGGSPIKGYVIEMLSSTGVKFKRVNKKLIKELTFKMADLTAEEEYEFRVIAENEAGQSKPSETMNIIAKDPFGKCLAFFPY